MTNIEKLAREAGAIPVHEKPKQLAIVGQENIQRFYVLVRAEVLEEAAKVCDDVGEHPSLEPRHCAASIRASKDEV